MESFSSTAVETAWLPRAKAQEKCDMCLRDTAHYPDVVLERDGESFICTDCLRYAAEGLEPVRPSLP